MGKPGAFLVERRKAHGLRPVGERVHDFEELYVVLSEDEQRTQASRCMACGVPFCQTGASFGKARPSGCPLHNLIPEWNHLVYKGLWADAAARLALTSPMPEFTSRVCPALCEAACNLGRNEEPETIHDNERAISDHEWAAGGPRRFEPAGEGAPRVAVVGTGPSGLVVGWELARRGARVTMVDRNDRPGGLLMYGIPNMKLDKSVVLRRTDLMAELGVEFRLGCDAADEGVAEGLLADFDAVVVAIGARDPRGVGAEGFDAGLACGDVVFAVDYLTEATKSLLDGREPSVSAAGRDVVVIGGGDTGNDCMGTAVRQGARSIRQLEFVPCAPEAGPGVVRWPEWPVVKKTDYGQAEAIAAQGEDLREWAVDTKAFLFDGDGEGAGAGVGCDGGAGGAAGGGAGGGEGAEGGKSLRAIRVVSLDWSGGKPLPIEESLREYPAQLVLVACGFLGPQRAVFDALGVKMPESGRMLPVMEAPGAHRAARVEGKSGGAAVFAAGDSRNGSSLVVSSMADAMQCVEEVAAFLFRRAR